MTPLAFPHHSFQSLPLLLRLETSGHVVVTFCWQVEVANGISGFVLPLALKANINLLAFLFVFHVDPVLPVPAAFPLGHALLDVLADY